MSAEKMREEFQSWLADYELGREKKGWMPLETHIQVRMYEAWQAARAAIEVEFPKVAEYFDQSEYPHTCEMLERDLRASIESLGLTVKP